MQPNQHGLVHESLISLAQAAKRIPPYRGRQTNPSAIFRWLRDGVRLPDGSVLRLEGLRLCGRWLTSLEALTRFFMAQDAAFNPSATPPASPMRSDDTRRVAATKSAERLRAMGCIRSRRKTANNNNRDENQAT
jgi:hypothetical protein